MQRRPFLFAGALVLTWTVVPILAQSSAPAGSSLAQETAQPPAATGPTQAPDPPPPDNTPAETPDQAAPTPDQAAPTDPAAAKPPDQTRAAPQTPGVRTGSVKVNDTVTVGGYGSLRYEANTLDKPKPSGFDFRRFVLTADATPNDRLQAYVEIEFERFAEIEVERAVDRRADGVAFAEDLEGGNG